MESKNREKSHQAQWLLTKLLSQRGKERQIGLLKPSFRIGLSGPPGAGKSTLIEAFGQLLTGRGFKVAVLVRQAVHFLHTTAFACRCVTHFAARSSNPAILLVGAILNT